MVNISDIEGLLSKTKNLAIVQQEKRRSRDDLFHRINEMSNDLQTSLAQLDKYNRASVLVGNASDATIKTTLEFITGVINRALAVIFPDDPRAVSIKHHLYRNAYPHFSVVLYTGHERKERSFKQSGSGLAQIISFLFAISLIDARKARPLLVIDELLNGLHPDAKALMRDMIKAVSSRYQFVLVEYQLDLGKQYLIQKKNNEATATHYTSNYYQDVNDKNVDKG